MMGNLKSTNPNCHIFLYTHTPVKQTLITYAHVLEYDKKPKPTHPPKARYGPGFN